MRIWNITYHVLIICSVILRQNLISCTRKNPHGNCKRNEFHCNSGQCIDRNLVCDGLLQCNDGSDETTTICSKTICPTYTFQCNYGACVKISSICNGIVDCVDKSDEPPKNSCKLPYINIATFLPFYPGITEETTKTTTKLYTPFNPQGWTQYTPYVPTNGGTTQKNSFARPSSQSTTQITTYIIPFDIPSTTPSSMKIKCRLPEQTSEKTYTINDCLSRSNNDICQAKPGTFVNFGTVLFVRCKSTLYINGVNSFSSYCFQGTWTPEIMDCESCGVLPFNETSHDDIPWQALIYQKSPNEIICWGSIISPYVIISAAHCFYDESLRNRSDISNFYIVLGNDAKTLNRNGRQFNISNIKFSQDGFQGSSTNYASDIAILEITPKIKFDNKISPICLDWKSKSEAIEETTGLTSTFKSENRNEYVKTETISYKSYEDCIPIVSDILKRTITSDKLCIFNYGIEHGNGGKGLYTKRRGEWIYRLRGIFSIGFFDSNQQVVTLTDLTKHLFWINTTIEEISQQRITQESIDLRISRTQ